MRRGGGLVSDGVYLRFYDDDGGGARTERVHASNCLDLWKCSEPYHWREYREPEVTQSQGQATILVASVYYLARLQASWCPPQLCSRII
jgi:hypothetical protein